MLQQNEIRTLKSLLPNGQVFTDAASLISYEVDAGLDRGRPEAIVFPHTAADVVRIVQWAATNGIPLVARGAGTGLSHPVRGTGNGAVAERGGIIVEFSRMNHILTIDEHGCSAVVEPGVINLSLDEQVKQKGLYFPLTRPANAPQPLAATSPKTLVARTASNMALPRTMSLACALCSPMDV